VDDIKERKKFILIEDTIMEAGQRVNPPCRKVAAGVVVENPYAGKYKEDLSVLIDFGAMIGEKLAKRAVEALGVAPDQVKGYGKGAIVGSFGELEHGGAILHIKLGKPFRDAVAGGKAIIPSSVKRGGPGTSIDVPLHHKDDEWQFDFLDSMEVSVGDAPGPNEIVVVLVVSSSGRPLARIKQKT
jgi:hypothetical protein